MKNIELYGYVLRFCVVIGVLCVNNMYIIEILVMMYLIEILFFNFYVILIGIDFF